MENPFELSIFAKAKFWNKQTHQLERYKSKYYNRVFFVLFKIIFSNLILLLRYTFLIFSFKKNKPINKNKLNIAIILDGGLGDVIINALYVQELNHYLDTPRHIDLYSKISPKIIEALFYKKDYINAIYSRKSQISGYDIILRLTRFPIIEHLDIKRISSLCTEKEKTYFKDILNFKEKYHIMCAAEGLYTDYIAMQYAKINGLNRFSQADILGKLDLKNKPPYQLDCRLNSKDALDKFNLKNTNFITIQRGVGNAPESTKLWSLRNYNDLCALIKATYPHIKILQLGVEFNTLIKNIDIDLRGKTSVEELKTLLKESTLHIDCECGMVHLRHALTNKKSLVIFGPTSVEFYGYCNNINIKSNTCGEMCEWLTHEWNNKCSIGFKEAKCMSSISPEIVFRKIKEIL